jgi:transposase
MSDEIDRTRVEKFRQLRKEILWKEIRGSEKYLVVGIDIGKEKHHAFFGTATGKALWKRLVFENSYEGFKKLLDQTEAVRVRNGLSEVVYGLEPTANYHKPLGDFWVRLMRQVVLVSGVAAKENRKTLDGRWDKHDTKDAANVADLICQGKCLFYEYPEVGVRELRELLVLKRRLKRL